MPTDIVGSKTKDFPDSYATGHEPSTRGYGDNGYQGPSSIQIGQVPKVSKQYASLATKTPNINADGDKDWQKRKISTAPIKSSPTMRNPNASPAKVPTTLLSRSVPPSVQPAKKGSYKR
jgi:hypothetical protein